MGPWPLKGRNETSMCQQRNPTPPTGPGTILFEPERLLQVARELRNGKGPVVIPGGAQQLNLPSSDVVDLLCHGPKSAGEF